VKTLTDVILEDDGKYIQYHIPDKHPAIVHIKKGGTIRVKRADTTLIEKAVRQLTRQI
jgi:hypothetical protein